MHSFSVFDTVTLTHVLIIIAVFIRIIKMRLPVATSLAWLVLVFFLPAVGLVLYLVVGEKRLGRKMMVRAQTIRGRYDRWLQNMPPDIRTNPSGLSPGARSLSLLAEKTTGIPAMSGNRLRLLDEAEPILQSIISDIDGASAFCHLEFYIWAEGGMPDEVAEALIKAAGRGVACRVILDAVGSARFLKGPMSKELVAKGVALAVVLPVSPLSVFSVRPDIRLHRKIVVIDDRIAYTGSFNLVDPRYFKQEANVGQWVDAMVRLEGPGALALNGLFRWDWEVATGRDLKTSGGYSSAGPAAGGVNVQVIPSGPGKSGNTIYPFLLMSLYSAREEIVMSTPYFVPDEAVTTALLTAAGRGIRVTIILPARNDSRLVHYTSRSYFEEMLAAGIRIFAYTGGLLHTKSVVIDREVALFGSVNLDFRSFWLDFEVTLGVYEPEFAQELLALQEVYIRNSRPVEEETWKGRSGRERFMENLARLSSPLL